MTKETTADDTINLASATLTGDVRDFLLDRLKNFQKPWVAMSEDEQRESIISAKDAAEHLVKQACRIIAAEGRNVVEANLDQITIKDGIKAVLTFTNNSATREALGSATGQIVLVVTSGAEIFTGEQKPALPIPNQSDLLDSAQALKDDKITPFK